MTTTIKSNCYFISIYLAFACSSFTALCIFYPVSHSFLPRSLSFFSMSLFLSFFSCLLSFSLFLSCFSFSTSVFLFLIFFSFCLHLLLSFSFHLLLSYSRHLLLSNSRHLLLSYSRHLLLSYSLANIFSFSLSLTHPRSNSSQPSEMLAAIPHSKHTNTKRSESKTILFSVHGKKLEPNGHSMYTFTYKLYW